MDKELLLDLLLGPLWFRLLLSGAPISPEEARSVVRAVLDGVASDIGGATGAPEKDGDPVP